MLVGVGAAHLRPEDALFAREMDGQRWHRCLRCDSWLPFAAPEEPDAEHPPDREEIELPLRGRPLRDKIVLRVIAVDRGFHFVVLALLAVAIFLFAANQRALRDTFYQVVTDVQQGFGGGPVHNAQHRLPARAGQGVLAAGRAAAPARRRGGRLRDPRAGRGGRACGWPSAGPST